MVHKIGYIFPGQGAQYSGMGKDLYDRFEIARRTYNEANEALDFDMKEISFNGSEQQLKQTDITQPVILTHSVACLRAFEEQYSENNGKKPDFYIAAGHSLGEYSALVAAGVLDFRDAIKLVRERGRCMENVTGAMGAIRGLSYEQVQQISEETNTQIANYNSPQQLVIAGLQDNVTKAIEIAKQRIQTLDKTTEEIEKYLSSTQLLEVSVPAHTLLMRDAAEEFREALSLAIFHEPQRLVIANVTGDYANGQDIKDLLYRQISNPVLWDKSIRGMISEGIDTIIEFGGGKGETEKRAVLTGLMVSTYRDMRKKGYKGKVRFFPVIDNPSLEETVSKLS